jgi:hypothetical protein
MKIVGTKPAQEVRERQTRQHWILTATPEQIETYINNNVTDLRTAKLLLIELAKVLSVVAKRAI